MIDLEEKWTQTDHTAGTGTVKVITSQKDANGLDKYTVLSINLDNTNLQEEISKVDSEKRRIQIEIDKEMNMELRRDFGMQTKDPDILREMPLSLKDHPVMFSDDHEFTADCKDIIMNVFCYFKARGVESPEEETCAACQITKKSLQQIIEQVPKDYDQKSAKRRFRVAKGIAKSSKNMPLSFVCLECGYACKFRNVLANHIKEKHEGIRQTFVCHFCGKSVLTSEGYKQHLRSHTGEKPYICLKCGQKFTGHNNLAVHERQHTGERPYACKFCGKTFTQSGTRRRHEVQSHTKDYKFQCQNCQKQFLFSFELKKHRKICKMT